MRPAAPRPLAREPFSPRLLIVGLATALVVAGIAYTAWRLRDKPETLARARASLENAQKAEPQAGKIANRADGAASAPTILADPSPAVEKAPQPDQPAAAADNSAPSGQTATATPPVAQPDQPAAPAPATQPDQTAAPAPATPPATQPDQTAASAPATPPAAQPDQTATPAPATPPADQAAAPVVAPPPSDQTATATPTPPEQAAPDANNAAGAPGSPAAPATVPAAPSADALPVTQRAALLVDAPNDPQKMKTYVGTVVWRSENVSPGQGQPLARAIHAEIDVPDLKLKLNMLLQKNFEQQFPASHTIDLRFTTQPGNALGNIKQIDLPQLRNDNAPAGDALAGLPVTITDNNFLIGLTQGNAETSNLDLIKSRNWIDIPFYFTSGTLAKITFEKGESGQHVIDDVLQSW